MGLGAWSRARYSQGLFRAALLSKMSNEWQEQRTIVAWYKEQWPEHTQALRVSMNGLNLGGGRKAAIMISQMRAQGMIDGEADIAILLPRGGYGSLIIEHKADESAHTVSDAQAAYLDYHLEAGNCALSTRGIEEAKMAIKNYMIKKEIPC